MNPQSRISIKGFGTEARNLIWSSIVTRCRAGFHLTEIPYTTNTSSPLKTESSVVVMHLSGRIFGFPMAKFGQLVTITIPCLKEVSTKHMRLWARCSSAMQCGDRRCCIAWACADTTVPFPKCWLVSAGAIFWFLFTLEWCVPTGFCVGCRPSGARGGEDLLRMLLQIQARDGWR